MKHLAVGIAILIFGLFVGGFGLATAGIGIGIPMLPIGGYLTYRGWRIYKHERETHKSDPDTLSTLEPLEKTEFGKASIGIILVAISASASALIVGIPILVAGLWFIYKAFGNRLSKLISRFGGAGNT